MKRIFTILLAFVMLFSIVVTPAFASTPSVSNDEISAVRSEMELRGMLEGNLIIDEVFDSEDTPKYLLGVTDKGYIILERKSLVFHESGEQNPYSAYMSAKKYYGGPLNYYVASTAQVQATNGQKMMYDILRDENTDTVAQALFLEREDDAVVENTASVQAIVNSKGEVRVVNYYDYIQRRAFGNNTDKTCSAVATGIALNYFALQFDSRIVPLKWRSEVLTTYQGAEVPNNYKKAHALHRYLVNTCGMGAASFGTALAGPLNKYIVTNVPAACGISATWTVLPKAATIKSKINANLPVIISTGVSGPYPTHSMVAYGYRDINGKIDLLVHTGHYGLPACPFNSGIGAYCQAEIWVSESYAAYGHYFSLS